MLNPPSHDAKSGCKITKKNATPQEKGENNSHESIFFTLLSSLFTFFRTFARDKSIK
jgi:hypothetical protein